MLKWYLSLDADGKNVLSDILAEAEYDYEEVEKTGSYIRVSFGEISSHVITADREQTIPFEIDSNSNSISVIAQALSPNGGFVDTEYIRVESSSIVIPRGLESGVYRVCFSIDKNSTNDDVYFTFVVK